MAHNGGITQINLSHPQYGGAHFFADHFKNGQGWGSIDNTTPRDLTKQDENGWPLEIYGGGQRDFFFTPSRAARPGNYIIDWENDGTVGGGGFDLVSGSLSSSLTRRAEVALNADTIKNLGITALGAVPLTNMRFYHADNENGIKNQGQIFGTKFLQRMHAIKPASIRFLDSIHGNTSAAMWWEDRVPVGHYTYAAGYHRKALYAGVSTHSGNDYSCTLAGFSLIHGARVIFMVDATALAGTCRLNVSSTGLYPLKNQYINYDGTDTIPYEVQYPTAGWLCSATFDEPLQCWIMSGGSLETLNNGLQGGWPPEIMIALCNEIGAHLSIPIPHFAANKETDFVDEFATLAHDTLDSGLKFQVEGPNEEWNSANGFTNYYYAYHSESDNDINQWYGRAISKMGDTLAAVFPGGKGTRYDLIIGVQTVSSPSGGVLNRFNSARYVTETGNAADAAYLKATQLHIANYWNASKYGEAEETSAAADYAAAVGSVAKAAVVHAYMSLYASAGMDEMFAYVATWAAFAVTKGLTIGAYEGGYSPDYTGTAEVNAFRAATKNWPGHYYLSCKMYRKFMKVYGGVGPSDYFYAGTSAWGILDPDEYVTPDPPRYTALVDTNAGKWPMRLTTS